ncbi:protein kinase [Gemmatirosa kalamazoonensis]|uniref:non-specific serine/threonine protein kinase n=1 Tax=Gemmatirosa kalamazoonensis TaxID=861299 RepID=W0REB1_9BACT|nr:serine/threonine-protein kinase [Gemmatirosa kalamazoonensis]AHG88767.1 protein kinase [Gemmatirosa kalamazoonensis]
MARTIPPERWRALEPLLDGALTLAPEQRAAYLDRACGADAALRAELEGLVRDCEAGESLLTRPAAAYTPLPEPSVPPLLADRYRVRRELGRGGMAAVYLADDEKHGRPVAVKVLSADISHAIGAERFRREIDVAARLSHPHILPLHDSGEDAGSLYYVMPFVAGESLRDRLRRDERLPVVDAVRIAREVALALDYAHREGVVHRDVKPENVLLQDGHAVVADFGIAHAVARGVGDRVTATGLVLGTPAYMSPEQATAAHDLDGRSDVYSLGCVLYELLTGRAPFVGATAQTVIARRLTAPPPDPRALRADVPAALASVVTRAMATDPGDRFATAAEMAAALDGASRGISAARARPRVNGRLTTLGVGVVAVAAVAAGVAALAALGRRASSPALDANVLAVAPFDVLDPSLALWKEGMVDVLSRTLDGAGPLRAVAPSTVVRRWHGRADAASARALGASTGAALVVYGGIERAGDSARATITVYDAAAGRSLGEAERVDVASRMDRLADSIAVAVLRELGRSRPVGATRLEAMRARSLPALRAFLVAEQFYRRALWDSARVHYEQAIELDSSLGIAYTRLAESVFREQGPDVHEKVAALTRLALAHRRGLPPRDSLFLTLDSQYLSAVHPATPSALVDAARPLVATAAELVRRYPSDPEAWRYDGDVWRDVAGAVELKADRSILALYDQAIAADSSFEPAYESAIDLSGVVDGAPSTRRYLRALTARGATGDLAQFTRLVTALLDRPLSTAEARRLVDSLPPAVVLRAMLVFHTTPDQTETAVQLGRALLERHATTLDAEDLFGARIFLLRALLFRGHLRESAKLLHDLPFLDRPDYAELATYGVVNADSADGRFRTWVRRGEVLSGLSMLAFWTQRRDAAALGAYAAAADSVGRADRSPVLRRLATYTGAAARAYASLARGDSADALRRFRALADSTCPTCDWAGMQRARLLLAAGRDREAADLMATAYGHARLPVTTNTRDVLWVLLRARAAERLGRAREATDDYAFVATAWRTADPELAPYAAESRAALARLTPERPAGSVVPARPPGR